MINTVSGSEWISLVTPFGIRFWDAVSGSVISDGLRVTAYPPKGPERGIQAIVNRQGVYILHSLPGLRALENGTGDANFWADLPKQLPFIIEVVDNERRFQAFSLQADLPTRGLFVWTCGSLSSPPLADMTLVPLYSAATRTVPGGMAVVRAQLWNPLLGQPAAFALVELAYNGQPLVQGFADISGQVALIFPYPEPVNAAFGSPAMTHIPLAQQTWTLQLQAAFSPLSPVPAIPDVCTIFAQPPATLWTDTARGEPLTDVTLPFGQELIVRSQHAGDHTPLSVVFITPGTH